MIVGNVAFNVKYKEVDEKAIIDKYQIEIDLNKVSDFGLPVVKETRGRIIKIADNKKISIGNLHLNN